MSDLLPQRPSVESSTELMPSSAGDVLAAFPCLTGWLVSSKWADGTPRATCALKMATDDGKWKLSLTDTAGGRVVYQSAPLLEEALLSLEQALVTSKAEWQKVPWANKRKK